MATGWISMMHYTLSVRSNSLRTRVPSPPSMHDSFKHRIVSFKLCSFVRFCVIAMLSSMFRTMCHHPTTQSLQCSCWCSMVQQGCHCCHAVDVIPDPQGSNVQGQPKPLCDINSDINSAECSSSKLSNQNAVLTMCADARWSFTSRHKHHLPRQLFALVIG